MSRFAIGVTLSPEERVQAGIAQHGDPFDASPRLSRHEVCVPLPDGTDCTVTYTRYGARSHRFQFGEPLHEVLFSQEPLSNTAACIEEKAGSLAETAFALAMQTEQKAMQRKSVPRGTTKSSGDPLLKVDTAAKFAGHYAVCLRFSSGRLTPVGPAASTPEQALSELAEGRCDHIRLFGQQRLVIGICCRYLRRWIEPRFLPLQRETGICEPEDEAESEA